MQERDAATFTARAADWRFGPVVYQIFVDRFAPSAHLEAKKQHYSAPRRLIEDWSEPLPPKGPFNREHGVSDAEMLFYGGDLPSIRTRLDHLQSLGVDLVYLNPIFTAFTNHKYDASDYFTVDPQYGTAEELRALVADIHSHQMRFMLDGVFNHVGRRHPLFQAAQAAPDAPERRYFTFGEHLPHGYLSWRNVVNLPELRLEDEAAYNMVFGEDGAIRHWIKTADIDGWRLDVAPDLGHHFLRQITDLVRATKPSGAVIGECWNYPEEWLAVVDGVLNMHARSIILELVDGRFDAQRAGRLLERMIEDGGIEGILRSHLVLDNHDLPRLATVVGSRARRRLARLLQFTLPGAPVIYYGSELDQPGGADPLNRAPMRWEMATDDNEELQWVRTLSRLRRENPALRYGDFRLLDGDHLLSFLRQTHRARETVIIAANPTGETIREMIPIRDSRLMDSGPLECQISGTRVPVLSGFIEVTVPAREALILRTADRGEQAGYSMLKRVE